MGVHDKAAVWGGWGDSAVECTSGDVLLEGWRGGGGGKYGRCEKQ